MLRVADLFCGAGGISQGFHLAGFRIVCGLDKDAAAVETFRNNHPGATVIHQDIESFDLNSLPEFDVLVGGPPCIEFSSSKGGRANPLDGLRLVQAFLRAVYERRPSYWVMENVPRLVLHLPDRIPLRWLGIDQEGSLAVPVRAEFNTADYGVPQCRRRFLMGNFPVPAPTHANTREAPLFGSGGGKLPWVQLRAVLAALPNPLAAPGSDPITDPNYRVTIPSSSLSDHFHEVILSDEEVARIRDVKTNHPYMGRMVFPDELDRPARTVVATQLGRETLVIGCRCRGKSLYRRVTVRESACLQSFPITYQFWGGSLNVRYRLVGDAVPPLLAYAIARNVLQAEGTEVSLLPRVGETPVVLAPPVLLKKRKGRQVTFPLDRRFSRMVPGKEVRGCRVDFDNLGTNPHPAVLRSAGCRNLVEWSARLCVGEGKASLQQRVFSLEEALWELAGFCLEGKTESRRRVVGFLEDASKELIGIIPDATTLQAVWARRWTGALGPDEITDRLGSLVDRHFPAVRFADWYVPRSGRFDLIPPRGLRVRIAAALVAAAFTCELTNTDARWLMKSGDQRYVREEWPDGLSSIGPGLPVPDPVILLHFILPRRETVGESA